MSLIDFLVALSKKVCTGVVKENEEYKDRVEKGIYSVPFFYPILVVFSVGLHIEELLNKKDVHHFIIVETDLENISHSLRVIDWVSLCERFSDAGKSLRLVYLPGGSGGEAIGRNKLQNVLNSYTPLFPLQAFFYNHRGLKKYSNIIDSIKKDITINYHQWGMYDDEINQFNNALHNLSSGFRCLNNRSKKIITRPVCIVGSGPSLDERINDLKKIRDKCIVVSCGTALQALHYQRIQPDFHVEIESHYATYESCIKKLEIEDLDYLKGITLLASAQVTPKACQAFKRTLIYFKDSSSLSYVFSNDKDKIHNATPTCTNAAVAIFKYLETSCILLFGCDMGFKGQSQHAKGSIYYDTEASDYIKAHTEQEESKNYDELTKIKSIHGEQIFTTGIYYTALKCLENSLSDFEGTVFNCSEGSEIAGSSYLTSSQLFSKIERVSDGKNIKNIESNLLHSCISALDSSDELNLIRYLKILNEAMEAVCSSMLNIISRQKCCDLTSAVSLSSSLIMYLERDLKSTYGTVYFMLRGSIWHFLHILLSHSMTTVNNVSFYRQWFIGFSVFLKACPQHCREVLDKRYPDMSDPWLNGSLHDVGEPK